MSTAIDVAMVAIVLFAFGLGFFVIHYAVGESVSALTSEPSINDSSMAVDAFDSMSTVTNKLDYVLFGLFIGLCLSMIVTAYLVGGKPIFMFFYFIVVIVVVAFSAVFANVWGEISTNANFGATVNAFPITNNILTLLPIYMAIIGFIGMVVLFAKPYFEL